MFASQALALLEFAAHNSKCVTKNNDIADVNTQVKMTTWLISKKKEMIG